MSLELEHSSKCSARCTRRLVLRCPACHARLPRCLPPGRRCQSLAPGFLSLSSSSASVSRVVTDNRPPPSARRVPRATAASHAFCFLADFTPRVKRFLHDSPPRALPRADRRLAAFAARSRPSRRVPAPPAQTCPGCSTRYSWRATRSCAAAHRPHTRCQHPFLPCPHTRPRARPNRSSRTLTT